MFFCIISSLCIRKLTWKINADSDKAKLLNFSQTIDHSNPQVVPGTFEQRYYEVAHEKTTGNYIILDIGGESDEFSPSGIGDFYEVLSKDLENATILTLEHRFFGKSLPQNDLKYETLKQLLTVDQAVEDLVSFRNWYQTNILSHPAKWLLIGGSYSGLLSAITRGKYPSEFDAAISSSGVVLATDDFKDFDRQIEISLGHQCATAARTARRRIDTLLNNGNEDYVLKLFNAEGVTKEVFQFVVGEMFSLSPQYGKRELLCSPLENTIITGEDPMIALAKFAREVFATDKTIYEMYANEYMKNDTNIEHPAARSWQWITCNELAYWQVAPGKTSLRSQNVTQDMFYQQCKDIFDENIPRPDVAAFNDKWGGLNQKGTKIIYTTGSQDPWTHLCITDENVPDGCYAHTIVGANNGHCRDLHGDDISDSKDLKDTRLAIRATIKSWIMD